MIADAALVELLVRLDRSQRADASGWVVLVTDVEFSMPNAVYGPCETPEEALILAGSFDRDLTADGLTAFRHDVLPIFDAPRG